MTSLVILAAGLGSRFGGPKQLEPVGPSAETIMEYAIFDALRSGFDQMVVVTRAEIAKPIRTLLEQRVSGRVPLRFVLQRLDDVPPGVRLVAERQKPWGTGQAVLCAEEWVSDAFAVVNADDFYGRRSYALAGEFLRGASAALDRDPPEYAAVGFPVRETLSEQGGVNRARLDTDADLLLQHVEELRGIVPAKGEPQAAGHAPRRLVAQTGGGTTVSLTGDQLVSMNMWAFTPAAFGQLRDAFASFLARHGREPDAEFLIPTAIEGLIASGGARVRVLPGGGPWCGMTYPQDTPRVADSIRDLVDQGEYPSPLWT